MKHGITFLLLTLPFALFGQKDSVDIWISRIDNSSIAGTCHYVWVIEPTMKEVNKLIKTGKPTGKKLLDLLDDEERGIIAHYILSNIYGQANYQTLRLDTLGVRYIYNGLEFMETDGRMHVEKSSLEKVKTIWIKKVRR